MFIWLVSPTHSSLIPFVFLLTQDLVYRGSMQSHLECARSIKPLIKYQVFEGPCSLKLCVPVSLLISLPFPTSSPSAENLWAHEQRYLSVKFTFYHVHDWKTLMHHSLNNNGWSVLVLFSFLQVYPHLSNVHLTIIYFYFFNLYFYFVCTTIW